jgi:hypothetical protein
MAHAQSVTWSPFTRYHPAVGRSTVAVPLPGEGERHRLRGRGIRPGRSSARWPGRPEHGLLIHRALAVRDPDGDHVQGERLARERDRAARAVGHRLGEGARHDAGDTVRLSLATPTGELRSAHRGPRRTGPPCLGCAGRGRRCSACQASARGCRGRGFRLAEPSAGGRTPRSPAHPTRLLPRAPLRCRRRRRGYAAQHRMC